jgi:DeoR/GlpR family transcriptional regulator of sugar metabolism
MISELEEIPWINLISTGGNLQHQWSALAGTPALDFLSKLNLEQAFISCGAISIERGIMTSFPFITEVLKKACDVSREVNLLVDSSKFSRVGTFSVMPVSSVKRIITDRGLDPKIAKAYRRLGVELI